MSFPFRGKVQWVGDRVPAKLKFAARALGCTAQPCDVRDVRWDDPALRAVLVPVDSARGGKAQGRVARLLGALDHGVLLGLVANGGDTAPAQEVQRRVAANADLPVDEVDIKVVPPAVSEFAQLLRGQEPALAVDPLLRIGGEPPGDDVDEILLRRAFNGFRRIELTEQPRGRSNDCRVWQVIANHGDDYCCEPFIAKVAPWKALKYELDVYRGFVREFVPFPFHAPCIDWRFVRGARRAVLVSMFVDRAVRFDQFVSATREVGPTISLLFQGALGTWRRIRRPGGMPSPGQHYLDEQRRATVGPDPVLGKPMVEVLPDPARLTRAFEVASPTFGPLMPPEEIWTRLEGLPRIPYEECYSHGDLNVGNLFVRHNSTDPIMIDFSHVGWSPASRDASKLEVSTALTVGLADSSGLSEDVLEQVYCHPLLPHRVPRVDGRTDLVRQVRTHVYAEGVSVEEYEITTACHLLRFAQAPANPAADQGEELWRRRALSYKLACGLVTAWPRQ